ncbi:MULTISPECIES: toxin-antitoxin system YwqK family antitoxin [unclassified Chitinophaga]|uniref:toxin-antitoxin system YwqK family antitoxin n=1 Tax=unclassified Chitinophaga TaxID=2619133 RepID=UPI0009C9086C|nr:MULTISPECIES: hypothetical protein [unclassified Chitinophaga]OMP75948.1 hypothetical protein BW716_27420 [[Flexibacter] sp. ATCC 35208]WPV64330.1 hypothetical protein QQL36_21245 [Chitinophaga sp. LS1]
MRKLLAFSVLQLLCFIVYSQGFTIKLNKKDDQKRKQGEWSEEVAATRGEDGYTWEGSYVDDRKEGLWKKYAPSGAIIAEETFKHNALNGPARYFYLNGLVSAEGNFVAKDVDDTVESYRVIDPVTQEEKFEEIKRNATSLRDGLWKIYDEDGNMVKEYYKRGEPVSAEELDTITNKVPKKLPAQPSQLPHQSGNKKH